MNAPAAALSAEPSLAIRVRDLVKHYPGRPPVEAVRGLTLEVRRGECFGLLGPNGAGKTTSFRMTCGMVIPDSGRVLLDDAEITDWPMYKRARDGGMGYLAQEQSVFRKLTVEQNLLAIMELTGMKPADRRRRCEQLLEQFDIVKIRRSKAHYISGGEKRRLEIARCLITEPRIILLDEPFTGIDPVTIHSIQKIIRGLRDDGISILITDHRERETLAITYRSYVIRAGKVLCHGTAQEVLNNPDAKKYYFGESPGVEAA
jgi:lipopolysaccharide export system ATP-binding protein